MKYMARIFIFWLAFSISAPVLAAEIEEKVDEKLAFKLVELANVVGDGALDGGTRDDGFFLYELWGKHSGAAGWYAVNPWTGDVWDIEAGPNCQRLVSPALRKEQEQIKKRFTKKELKEYKRLSDLKPSRMPDLEPCGSPEEK